jgi:hypothetical protein
MSAAGVTCDTGNLAVDAQEVINAIAPIIAILLIVLIFVCYLISCLLLTLFGFLSFEMCGHYVCCQSCHWLYQVNLSITFITIWLISKNQQFSLA